MRGDVDIVVHAGDLLFRSRVPTALVQMAMEPMVRVAERGVPVLIVPGNHERSQIPMNLWTAHPNLHVFDRPQTYLFDVGGLRVAAAGFPFGKKIRDTFASLVNQTGHLQKHADVRVLCFHQTVEGAQVGTQNYTFRSGPDVIRGRDIPSRFAVILGGHIHRSQVLQTDLRGNPMAAPVVYPGSIERTSFAERNEKKHYALVDVAGSDKDGGDLVGISFIELPTRPMVNLIVDPKNMDDASLRAHLHQRLSELDPDSVVRVQIRGGALTAHEALRAPALRQLAPKTMNVSLAGTYRSTRGSREKPSALQCNQGS
jgi:DNA repair exonuclease SbcCD nuclease subunit